MTGRIARDDRGSSLLLVMVFVVGAALAATAFLERTSAGFKATTVLRNNLELKYATDAGIELGIQRLRQDLASAGRSLCLTPFSPPETVATTATGSRSFPVTVQCQTLQGFASSDRSGRLYGAAIITTGGPGSLRTQSGDLRTVDGTVYTSGAVATGDLDKDVVITNGDFAVFGCSGTPAVARVRIASGYTKACTSVPPVHAAPEFDALPLTPPAPAQLPLLSNPVVPGTDGFVDFGQCRVFFPGTYVRQPDLRTGGGTKNFFLSGLYYFRGFGDLLVPNNAVVIAGRPSSTDTGIAGADLGGCPNDPAAIAARVVAGGPVTTTGATFVFGGSSAITISGVLLMHSPEPASGIPQPNVYTVRSSDPAAWSPWSGGSQPVLEHQAAGARMRFNAPINAFDAPVTLWASQPSVTVVESGVVAKTLLLQASTSGSQMRVSGYSTDPTAGERVIRLTSTAEGVGGEGVRRTAIALVRIKDDATAPVVLSWRIE